MFLGRICVFWLFDHRLLTISIFMYCLGTLRKLKEANESCSRPNENSRIPALANTPCGSGPKVVVPEALLTEQCAMRVNSARAGEGLFYLDTLRHAHTRQLWQMMMQRAHWKSPSRCTVPAPCSQAQACEQEAKIIGQASSLSRLM